MSNFPAAGPPLVVTLVDDSDLAVAGLRVLLEPFAERVVLADDREAVARPGEVDVVLYEPRSRSGVATSRLESLMDGGAGRAIAYSWAPAEDGVVSDAVLCLPKTLAASQLVVALEEVVAGRHPGLVVEAAPPPEPKPAKPAPDPDVQRLTSREHDVLSLIAQGLPNRDIATRLELSLNSVKTYIRTAYRKIGAERRTQAVLWGLEHGLVPDAEGAVAGV
jgi:DNA-binding NarL/FixJ family response regulator